LSTTFIRFDKNCNALKENIPLLFTTFINRFEGSCGTFGEEKKFIIINDIGSVCPYIYNNNHGVDVSMIIVM
jgi:hypothetical protein